MQFLYKFKDKDDEKKSASVIKIRPIQKNIDQPVSYILCKRQDSVKEAGNDVSVQTK